jgi:hypothetical protein
MERHSPLHGNPFKKGAKGPLLFLNLFFPFLEGEKRGIEGGGIERRGRGSDGGGRKGFTPPSPS